MSEKLGIATHKGNFGLFPNYGDITEIIYSGKQFIETVLLTVNRKTETLLPKRGAFRILVNGVLCDDGKLETNNNSRTFKLTKVKTIEISTDERSPPVIGEYIITVLL